MQRLGAAIRDRRVDLGLTQEELADRMAELGDENIRQSDISRIEGGHVQLPRFERLNYLSEALGLSIGEVFINAGWIQVDDLADVLAAENQLQVSAPELQNMGDGNHPEGSGDEASSQPTSNPDSQNRFARNRREFERVRDMYEVAKEDHELRHTSDLEKPR